MHGYSLSQKISIVHWGQNCKEVGQTRDTKNWSWAPSTDSHHLIINSPSGAPQTPLHSNTCRLAWGLLLLDLISAEWHSSSKRHYLHSHILTCSSPRYSAVMFSLAQLKAIFLCTEGSIFNQLQSQVHQFHLFPWITHNCLHADCALIIYHCVPTTSFMNAPVNSAAENSYVLTFHQSKWILSCCRHNQSFQMLTGSRPDFRWIMRDQVSLWRF